MPRVLVSGANGVLGRSLLQRLAGEATLRAAVRSERAAQSVRALDLDTEIVLLPGYTAEHWRPALEGVDAVAHTVGILKESSRSRYRDAHEGSVAALCEAIAGSGCDRVVYLSIVGAAPDSPNACLASKARAEGLLLKALPSSLVLRLPMVLGGGDPASAALCARAESRRAWLLGGGRALDQPIDTRDAVDAIAVALCRTEPVGTLELAGPEVLAYRDLLRRVATRRGTHPQIAAIPSGAARLGAWLAERLLRDPPISVAMLDILLHDDSIDAGPAWRTLGLAPRPLDETLDHWFGDDPE